MPHFRPAHPYTDPSALIHAAAAHEGENVFCPEIEIPLPTLPKMGELRLLRAILHQAADDLVWPHRKIRAGPVCMIDCPPCTARTWIADDGAEPYSFRWMCELLGLDASAVRKELR